jgi:SAM-dependent methyltransferase
MNLGFPTQLISKLCCTADGEALELDLNRILNEGDGLIRNGTLHCRKCKTAFQIHDGILNMLKEIAMDDESEHERQLRNEKANRLKNVDGPACYQNEHNSMEMIPTLDALSVSPETTILELGCGDGRYTVQLAGQCKWILAIDFSIDALRLLQQRLQETRNVGLVLGDVTTLKVMACFDRVLSTLVSNLPTREHRNSMYCLAANALKPNGRFVFSTHNHGFRQKVLGEPKSGRYSQGGIYRYNFTVSECKEEVRPYFKVISARPIQIYFPFARRLRLPLFALSRFLEHIPLINGLGNLILCTAEQHVLADPNVRNA